MIDRNVWITVKKLWPIICWRTWSRAIRALSASKEARSASWRWNTLASSTPDTDRDSSVSAVRSATVRWVAEVTRRRRSPTSLVSQKNTGTRTSATMVSCHDSTSIATSAEAKDTTLPRIEVAVDVTTDCTPATSLVSRLWISPVRVAVKNRIDICWRWPNSRDRRSRMTC